MEKGTPLEVLVALSLEIVRLLFNPLTPEAFAIINSGQACPWKNPPRQLNFHRAHKKVDARVLLN